MQYSEVQCKMLPLRQTSERKEKEDMFFVELKQPGEKVKYQLQV